MCENRPQEFESLCHFLGMDVQALKDGEARRGVSEAPMTKDEYEEFRAGRRVDGMTVDPEACEVMWQFAQVIDPYGVLYPGGVPPECDCVGRAYFARAVGSDVWVEFGDLREESVKRLWERNDDRLVLHVWVMAAAGS